MDCWQVSPYCGSRKDDGLRWSPLTTSLTAISLPKNERLRGPGVSGARSQWGRMPLLFGRLDHKRDNGAKLSFILKLADQPGSRVLNSGRIVYIRTFDRIKHWKSGIKLNCSLYYFLKFREIPYSYSYATPIDMVAFQCVHLNVRSVIFILVSFILNGIRLSDTGEKICSIMSRCVFPDLLHPSSIAR